VKYFFLIFVQVKDECLYLLFFFMDKHYTIMFVDDVVGSTKKYDTLGDAETEKQQD
jgi:hypothetical protein